MAGNRSTLYTGGRHPFLTTGTSYVDATYGSDTTGTPYRPDLPYATLAGASSDAISGDHIDVYPGTYNERNWIKNGVNWNFKDGANVIYSGAVDGAVCADGADGTAGAVTFNITGKGIFRTANTITSAATLGTMFFHFSNTLSVVNIEAREISSTANGTAVANAAVKTTLGTINYKVDLITASHDAGMLHAGGATDWTGGRLTSTKASTEGVTVSGAGLVLHRGVILPGSGGTASVDAGSAMNVRVYGVVASTVSKGSNITFTVGSVATGSYLVDADVT